MKAVKDIIDQSTELLH